MSADGLSHAQRAILLWLHAEWEHMFSRAQESGDRDAIISVLTYGVPWRLRDSTPSGRASVSRSIRRLAARGLVERIGADGGANARRTWSLKITTKGTELAQRLTTEDVNRSEVVDMGVSSPQETTTNATGEQGSKRRTAKEAVR